MSRRSVNVLLVLGIAVLVGGVAYVLSSRQPDHYESIARLYFAKGAPPALQVLGPQFGEPDVKEEIKLATAAFDMNSLDVAIRTAKDYPILKMTPGEVAADVEARPVRDTLIVEVVATTSNGFVAAVLAKDYVTTYYKVKRERDTARALGVKRVLQSRYGSLSSVDQAGPRGQAIQDQIAQLDTLARVGTAGPQLIEEPRPSTIPVSPKPTQSAVFGALFGLAVGAGLVALRSGGRNRSDVDAARQMSARPASHGPPPP
ncbi:MAG: hypothetical protein QOE06_2834 [Thermoleophilaceae bacterium]|jgi:uncharacterized protein involved in exopolysaccharide biosynthesis|nr:hypothetical protein [Thermoleophilaceae bacterium]